MDSDQGKLFIGGISWETTEEKLKGYFSTFGEVVEALIMKDRVTGRARGFGFIVFADPSVADMVVLEKHSIDGRMVEAKKAVPRDEQQSVNRNSNGGVGSPTPSNPARTKKIFVGGLASTVTENDFKKYFGQFGTITDVVVMYDHGTQRPRGFGFITYDSEDSVDRVLMKNFHELNDKMVEVKRAVPKDMSAGPSRSNGLAGMSRGSPYVGGHGQAFSSSPIMSYGSQMDSRYGSSPSNRGLYPPYGTIGLGFGRNHSASVNGAYNPGMYGGGAFYGGGGYGANMYGGSLSGGGYGNIGNSGSGSNANAYSSLPGRSLWGSEGSSYGGSVGFEGNQVHSLSSNGGTGTWSAPRNSSAGYGSHSYGYEGVDSAFTSSTSFGYGGQSSSHGNSLGGLGLSRSRPESIGGLGISRSRPESSNLRGNIYGNSGLNDSTWRATPADKVMSVSAGFGGLGNGAYGLNRGADSSGEDILGIDEEYGVSGRHSFRGVPV